MSLNVYVSGIPSHWMESDLLNVFSVYGPIESVKLLLDRDTKSPHRHSKGVGFVHFRDSEAAQIAIQALNGHVPKGEMRPLQVKIATQKKIATNSASNSPHPPRSRSTSPVSGHHHNGNNAPLSSGSGSGAEASSDETSVAQTPPSATSSLSQTPSYHPMSNSPSSSTSSVSLTPNAAQFRTFASARNLSAGNLATINSNRGFGTPPTVFPVPMNVPSLSPPDEFNIYVAGFPDGWGKEELNKLFSPYGKLGPIKLLQDPQTKQCRGVGFVRFSKYEEATAAIAALNNYIPEGAQKALQVKFASRKIDPSHYSFSTAGSAAMMPMGMQMGMQMPLQLPLSALQMQQAQQGAPGQQSPFMFPSGSTLEYQAYIAAAAQAQAQAHVQAQAQAQLQQAQQTSNAAQLAADPALALAYQQYYAALQAQMAALAISPQGGQGYEQFAAAAAANSPFFVHPSASPVQNLPAAGMAFPASYPAMTGANANTNSSTASSSTNGPSASASLNPLVSSAAPSHSHATSQSYLSSPFNPSHSHSASSSTSSSPAVSVNTTPDPSSRQLNPAACLYVSHFPVSYSETDLYDLFSPFGHILSTRIIRDPATQLSRQYGFVNYQDESAAEDAIRQLNGYQVGNKLLKVTKKTGKAMPNQGMAFNAGHTELLPPLPHGHGLSSVSHSQVQSHHQHLQQMHSSVSHSHSFSDSVATTEQ